MLGTDMEREYSLHALATRPGVTLKAVAGMTKTDGAPVLPLEDFSDDELFQAETEVKYLVRRRISSARWPTRR